MKPQLAFVVVPLSLLGMTVPVCGETGIKQPPQTSTTERVNFAPGGTIRISGSDGDLNVQGWDQPTIEVTVIKSLPYGYKPNRQDRATAQLDRVHIVNDRKSPSEMTISTAPPTGGAIVEYEIHVPRDSRLVIHNGTGSVSVNGVSGDIDARAARGDILLWLPPGSYSLDARTKFGVVSSDLEGTAHNKYLIGESFTRANPPPSHRLYLRMGFGGITLKEIFPESEPPATATVP